ncbi:MAG: HIT family protein [Tannerellaceae bacterium]|jgi:histidine triad (HIT) family protein|nr:HIT family protein [Tannerellaceae bacterium]
MATIFSRIIAGEIPCHKVAEDKDFIAFLDIRPINGGHTLVVPKVETDYLFDLSDDVLSRMLVFAKKVAGAIKEVVECKRIGLMVIGLEVPHAHIHLIPINSEADMFNKARVEWDKEKLSLLAAQIRETSSNLI